MRWLWAACVAALWAVALGVAQTPAGGGGAGAAAPRRADVSSPDTTPIRPQIPSANRYQRDRIFLERARELRKERQDSFQIVVGDVMFRKGDMYMYCDSAHFFDAPGALQAYGNVRMEQGDTLFVYADELQYADTTEMAVLYADPGKKVRLINRDVTLLTDIFNYDTGIELGYYEVGGELTDRQNNLRSIYGEYSPSTKDALFQGDVRLRSIRGSQKEGDNNHGGDKGGKDGKDDADTLRIFTEEMLYNTDTHLAELDTISTIHSKDGTIYTTHGLYNTATEVADLYRRSLVVASNGNTLTGDTLYFDRDSGYGEARGNIELTDTANKIILTGDFGFYFQRRDSARVYGHALAREYSQADTLYLHGDTIRTFTVVTPEHLAEDSTVVAADSTHHMVASPRVRFYRSDLQGLCDSMTFVQKDSVLYLDRHPVVWNENKQIFGNQITVFLNDSTVERALLPDFGFMAEEIEDEFFNQLSGKQMEAFFTGGELTHMDVNGNVQAVMLPQENDSTYNKIANIESSFLAADFKERQVERMKMWPETSGTMTPLYLAKKSLYHLPAFRWFAPLRPASPDDVFHVTREMVDLFNEPPFGSRGSSGSSSPTPRQTLRPKP